MGMSQKLFFVNLAEDVICILSVVLLVAIVFAVIVFAKSQFYFRFIFVFPVLDQFDDRFWTWVFVTLFQVTFRTWHQREHSWLQVSHKVLPWVLDHSLVRAGHVPGSRQMFGSKSTSLKYRFKPGYIIQVVKMRSKVVIEVINSSFLNSIVFQYLKNDLENDLKWPKTYFSQLTTREYFF